MKRRIVLAMTAIMIMIGCNGITADGAKTDTTRTVSKKTTQTQDMKVDKTEVYYSKTKKEFDQLETVLENRNGKIIIEIFEGTVLDNDGNGQNDCGGYIHYDTTRFSEGDRVQTVFVYNPNTNYIDDILYRTDTKLE